MSDGNTDRFIGFSVFSFNGNDAVFKDMFIAVFMRHMTMSLARGVMDGRSTIPSTYGKIS